MLTTDFEADEEGMTVPYPPLFDDVRHNCGFVDVRGRPDLAAKIAEGAQSQALGDLLLNLSEPGSYLFTLGCDLGSHEEPEEEETARNVAGGYVQVMRSSYSKAWIDDYVTYANAIEHALDDRSMGYDWRVRFVLKFVDFRLDNFSDLTPSLWIWFFAAAHTPASALASREILIGSLHSTLTDERLMAAFEERYCDEASAVA